ncbi:sensor histidine kinase [Protaetiibacter sp. SSC-01]|uniref:sensor histidine kinase n=1 Tax=Protaetiibacter sp. SSC-01 TaxID=2759943 RepID=UPI00165740EA|nr:sensor histidine kinase [Protaetiibacter sp. SSC-01]QNO37571.1 sensor histidine kinase [Protaetiibacter sp. SSC-01]
MTARAAARLTGAVGLVVSIACVAGGIALDLVLADAGEVGPVAPGWTGLSHLAMAITGAVLLMRVAWHPIAIVLLGFGVLGSVGALASAWVGIAARLWTDAPLAEAALFVNQRLFDSTIVAVPLVLVLFPDGRLPRSRPLRAVGSVAIVAGVLPLLGNVLKPWEVLAATYGGADPDIRPWFRPGWGLPLDLDTWIAIDRVLDVCMFTAPVLGVLVLIGRRFGAGEELRRQLRWIAWAGVLLVIVLVGVPFVAPWAVWQMALVGAVAVMCVAVAIAILRYRLESIDRVIGWTILYGLLLVAVVLVDVALLAVVGGVLGENTVALVAAIIVLIASAPLREPLLAWITRIVYGRRGDPYGVVAGLADSLEHSDDADDQLDHVVRSVARAFASPFVAVRVDQPDGSLLSASHGTPQAETTILPLTYRGEAIGELEMAPPRRSRLSRRDERLLADVVRQAAAAVRATVLNVELQRSREELVLAREEERSRLRRDVHDGLGPALAAVKVRIDAARNVAADDPAQADRILEVASRTVTDAVGDIRRIVHDLRPPTLDDLGLRAALERVCDSWDETGPIVSLGYALEGTPPPAIEVAVYRIASEAVNNARRHAAARTVRLAVSENEQSVVVEIVDDGGGIPRNAPAGVGLRSMRERAAELGGELVVSSGRAGTTIRATIPRRGALKEAARA